MVGIPGMKVFSFPSVAVAHLDFFLRFRSPPLLLASPTPLLSFSTTAARNSSAKRNLQNMDIHRNSVNLPSRLESLPLEAMLLPLLVPLNASVIFFDLSRSFAFAAAIAKAEALGPAEDVAVELE